MSMTRAPSSGSPPLRSSSIRDTRLSARRFWVCNASLESRSSGEPSTAVATFTSEQYGSPEPAINVANAPERPSRSNFFAAVPGSKVFPNLITDRSRVKSFSLSGLKSQPNHIVVAKRPHFRPDLWGSKHAGPSRKRGNMPTIALVDDDRNILTSVSMALEAEGYRIMTYTDGASALDGFKSSPPDLAILDIKMPRMDGMETLRR